MATLTLAEISAEMAVELGSPSGNVEINDATIQDQWSKALDIFNDDVGKGQLLDLDVTADTQGYDIPTLFPALTIRKIIDVFIPEVGSTTVSSLEENLGMVDYTYNDPASIVINNQLKAWNIKPYKFDWAVVAPLTLMIIPAPTSDATYKVYAQIDYVLADLPNKYEKVVRAKALANCLDIILTARSRLATPMRSGEYVAHSRTSARIRERIDALNAKYFDSVKSIMNSRRI